MNNSTQKMINSWMYPRAKIRIIIFFVENDDCPNQMFNKKSTAEDTWRVPHKSWYKYENDTVCYPTNGYIFVPQWVDPSSELLLNATNFNASSPIWLW